MQTVQHNSPKSTDSASADESVLAVARDIAMLSAELANTLDNLSTSVHGSARIPQDGAYDSQTMLGGFKSLRDEMRENARLAAVLAGHLVH